MRGLQPQLERETTSAPAPKNWGLSSPPASCSLSHTSDWKFVASPFVAAPVATPKRHAGPRQGRYRGYFRRRASRLPAVSHHRHALLAAVVITVISSRGYLRNSSSPAGPPVNRSLPSAFTVEGSRSGYLSHTVKSRGRPQQLTYPRCRRWTSGCGSGLGDHASTHTVCDRACPHEPWPHHSQLLRPSALLNHHLPTEEIHTQSAVPEIRLVTWGPQVTNRGNRSKYR
jgi:hypothetical protein